MLIIDPLRLKVQEFLLEGQPFPLNQALQSYGTMKDIDQLVSEVEGAFSDPRMLDPRRYCFIDLTPFDRIGHLKEMVEALDKFRKCRPVLMIMSEAVLRHLMGSIPNVPVLVTFFSDSGQLIDPILGGTEPDQSIRAYVDNDLDVCRQKNALANFRRPFTDYCLTELLFSPRCIEIPYAGDGLKRTKYISGRYYLEMSNGMFVSCYLNLKEIGRKYENLIRLAHEIVINLTEHFRKDKDALSDFDALVTPNNTALFIASAVQAILEKPLITIDRLGPIPALQLQSPKLRQALQGKRVVVIVEVVSTGNEVDRTIMFLNHIGAKLVKIIALYNLEVGKPLLLQPGQLVSLCRPKEELKYVYRSQ